MPHAMDFVSWTRAVARYVRTQLPEVTATRHRRTAFPAGIATQSPSGPRVILRYRTASVIIIDNNGTWWTIAYRADDERAMPPLYDAKAHSLETAHNIGATIVGFFEPNLSRPDHRRH